MCETKERKWTSVGRKSRLWMDVTEVIVYATTDGRERVGLVVPAQAYEG